MHQRFQIGEQIGEYRVEGFLGAGGMGAVYWGVHAKLGRPAAIKVLGDTSQDESFKARFFNEARLQGTLHHPNIAALYDFLEVGGQLCIIMEFVDGESLEEMIERRAFSVEDAAAAFASIVEAIGYIHKNGVIHRDIKAANVKINSAGTVKLLDFGIAKDASSNKMTQTGGIVGTPYYLAPEQLAGQPASERTDIWALGVLFYEMLAGAVPFKGDTLMELCNKIATAKFEPIENLNPAVPRSVSRVINRCLKKNASERYQTAEDLLTDVRRATNSAKETRTSSVATALSFFSKQAPANLQPAAETQSQNSNYSQSNASPQFAYQSQQNFSDDSTSRASDFDSSRFSTSPAPERSPLLMIAGVAAAAVILLFVIGGIAVWTLSGNSKPTVLADEIKNGNLKSNQAVVVSSAPLRKVKVDVDEGRAQVLRNGSSVGQTPFDLEARDGEKINLTLQRQGFEDKNVQLEISSGKQVYTFSLKQK